jgi:hypothetical protein
MTCQTKQERIAAIESLLALMEAHQHVTTTPRAQWVSDGGGDPVVIQAPEPDCECHCPPCPYLRTRSCTLREERWAAVYESLRRRYPQLHTLEQLVFNLGHVHARWAAAIYRVYVPLWDWDVWDEEQERALARLGVGWIEERMVGWVPLHVEVMPVQQIKRSEVKRQWVAEMVRAGFTSARICKETHCSERLVVEVRKTLGVDVVR